MVQLSWTTFSEVNNYGFYVERRQGTQGSYSTVSNLIPGAGTSLEQHDYSWSDSAISAGTYSYRLRQVDLNGDVAYSAAISVIVNSTLGVNDVNEPLEFKLKQNYPNPFNPSTLLKYSIKEQTFTTLKIYNIFGEVVATLVNEVKQPGRYNVQWKAGNSASGMYVYRLTAGRFTDVKKMLLLK